MWFLLFALVQVASPLKVQALFLPQTSALCTCASCFDEKLAKVKENIVLLLCALVQVASAKLHSSLRQAVEAICIGAQLHIISKCELPFNSTIDSNDMIVRRANLSWQQ